jgi:hypothetical protein
VAVSKSDFRTEPPMLKTTLFFVDRGRNRWMVSSFSFRGRNAYPPDGIYLHRSTSQTNLYGSVRSFLVWRIWRHVS